jgi:predicted LPLAT superfamily acyltransferase
VDGVDEVDNTGQSPADTVNPVEVGAPLRDGRGASPNYGGKLGFGFFHVLIRLLGVRAAYVWLGFVVPYYVLLRPSARRSASHYLRRRFPARGPAWRFFATIRYFFRFGQVLIDQGVVGIRGMDALRVEFPDERELYDRAHQRKGLVLLTSHVGGWQSAMACMRFLELPVHFQFRREAHTEGRHFFDLAGLSGAFRIVDPAGFLGGMVQMTGALAAGECVSVMGDRAWGARTLATPFLGAPAAFPISAYHLATVTGADLVALLTVRTGPLTYRIESRCLTDGLDRAALSREEAIAELLRRYAAFLESYLEKHPFMWFNFFDFWAEGKATFE